MFNKGWKKNSSFHGFWAKKEAVPNPSSEARYAEIVKSANMMGAIYEPYVKNSLFRLKENPESDDNYYRVITNLQIYETKSQYDNPFHTPPEAAVSKGDVLIGETLSNPPIPVRITKQQAFCPITLLAGTGAGKTVFSQNLILNNSDVFDSFWIFDLFGKDNWVGIIRFFNEINKKLSICPWLEDKTNLVHSSRLTPFERSASGFMDSFSLSFDVKTHSKHYLRSALRHLNPLSQDSIPCLADVLLEVSKSGNRFDDSLIEKLEDICSVFPQYKLGWDFEKLLRLSILWELVGLDREIQIFTVARKVLAAFESAILSKLEKGLMMVIDEGNRVFIAGSKLAETVSIVRAARICSVICFQSLSSEGGTGISQYVIENAATKLLGRAGFSSMDKYATALGLNQAQKEYAKKYLRPGLFVILHPNYGEPFLITVPNIVLPCVTEEEIDESKKPLRALPAVPAKNEGTETLSLSVAHSNGSGGLSENEASFLKEVCEHPWDAAVQHYKRLPFSTSRAVKIKNWLIQQCLIQPYEDILGSGKKGRARLYFEPTQSAFKILGLEKTSWGRGGYSHALYLRLIGHWLKQKGYEVQYEKKYGNKFVDLVAMNANDGTSLAVEFELSTKHWKENLIGCLAAEFSAIWIVGPDNVLSEIEPNIQTIVNSDMLTKVSLKKLSLFF
ncbi:MAG: hypothetical protein V1701_03215 [Planctomycetota bacterium]